MLCLDVSMSVLQRWDLVSLWQNFIWQLRISKKWMEWATYKRGEFHLIRRGSRAHRHKASSRGCRFHGCDSEIPLRHTRCCLDGMKRRGGERDRKDAAWGDGTVSTHVLAHVSAENMRWMYTGTVSVSGEEVTSLGPSLQMVLWGGIVVSRMIIIRARVKRNRDKVKK